MMISPERLLELARAQGWDRFKPQPQTVSSDLQHQHDEIVARQDDFRRVFQSPEGQRAIVLLIQMVMMRPLLQPWELNQTAEQHAVYAAFREGQNSVVELINRMAGQPTTPMAEPTREGNAS